MEIHHDDPDGFESVGEIQHGVLKEISRRAELRQRLEAELGRPISDEEFIALTEQTGMRI